MTRFTEPVATMMPTGTLDVLRAVTADRHTSMSQYVREAVMDRLKADTKQASERAA